MSDDISYLLSQTHLTFKVQRPARTVVNMDGGVTTEQYKRHVLMDNGCPVVSDSSDEELRRLYQKTQHKSFLIKKAPLEPMAIDEPFPSSYQSHFWSHPGLN
eukprot:TRINITY_DN5605_c0_g3_i1.p1 TRINITY_DN5605_c0_g3~~TRINITY_DN5605_c0_g3_i1.p1  ORF type:complete len:102 (+),score=0.50 TRINITY_DN5605_c0_g3_i1:123-428(+)